MTFGSLFSGIGGLDLGLERAGMRCLWQVENNPYCRRVLAKHWPDVPRYADVKQLTGYGVTQRWTQVPDMLCGGFPCQPVSVAGKRKGQEDERWLWPEFGRLIREIRPRLVLLENVPGLLVRGYGDVLGDLAACGYDAEWDCIPAAAVGAHHARYRVFVIAYPMCDARRCMPHRVDGIRNYDPWDTAQNLGGWHQWKRWLRQVSENRDGTPSARDFQGMDDGVLAELDRHRALGNAVVPQVGELIGRWILAARGDADNHEGG